MNRYHDSHRQTRRHGNRYFGAQKGEVFITYSIPATLFLSISLIFALFGCEDTDSYGEGDSDPLNTLAREKVSRETICDFGSPMVTFGDTYAVSIENEDLKKDKDYFVEIQLGSTRQSPSIVVQLNGMMVIDMEAEVAGSGAISVYETGITKGKEERRIKAFCTFEVEDVEIGTNDTDDTDDTQDTVDTGDTGGTDLCPYDFYKTEPGECGCGVPDSDSDADKTPDCKDDCPLDPYKTEPGECGCGVPEGRCGPDDGEYSGLLDENHDTSSENLREDYRLRYGRRFIWNSTRRLAARPDLVSLDSIGRFLPYPLASSLLG